MNDVKRPVTLDDISKRAKVSKMTVSRVLTGKGQVAPKTREKINKIIDELGYQPNLLARSLSSQKTSIIGVVLNKREHMFMFDYTTKVLSGIMDVAIENDYQLMLCPISADKDTSGEYEKLARSRMLDGVILLKRKEGDPHISELIDLNFPFVMLNYKKFSEDISFVDSENFHGAQIAVEHLYGKGHRKIAFVRGRIGETNSNDRYLGYQGALSDLGLEFREEWVINGDFNQEKAYSECSKLLDLDDMPTAIFCADDNMALGVMRRLQEQGLKIPEDMAVVGFDDIQFGTISTPTLTTVRQPIYEIGRRGMEVLLHLINSDEPKATHELLPVELVKREST